ncbi:hypothetical protein KFK09_020219 [Dendrobium nobile]|uniref:Pentatricopeptide repeat-containing protein n=1 Tax=Dendrobium nobile TaxID=94219 RepID=A0A8T3ARQ5_DENNO|nr:hypothetical protein KFK09_020219 [Dendrobium nobile]
MNPKTGNAVTLLLCCRYMLRSSTSKTTWSNSKSLYSPLYLNVKPSSQNDSPIPYHNLISSANFYDHFKRTDYLLLRLRCVNSTGKVQTLPFFITCTRSFSRKPGVQHSPGRPSSPMQYSRRSSMVCKLGLEPEKLAGIVEEISRDADDMESNLDKLNFMVFPITVAEVLCALNHRGLSAVRFFDWVLKYHPSFKPNSEIYNLIVNNLGRVENYSCMSNVLSELSSKGYCLTEKAFTFLKFCSSSTIKDSVRTVTEVLNGIRGPCRGSGIHALIKLLCAMNSFELAFFVMEETVRKTSYYNLLIAAKCQNGDFRELMDVFDEMRTHGCDPNIKSYNYLLGSLFKNDRVIEACEILQVMEAAGYVPDLITYEVVASHACKANRLDYAIEILNLLLSEGIKPRPTTHAAFIKGLFWSGRVENAYNYVIEMSVKDKCSNNCNFSLLANLFRLSGRVVEAGSILHEMMVKGIKPNFPVYIKVLKDLHSIARGDLASELKSMFVKFNSNIDAG